MLARVKGDRGNLRLTGVCTIALTPFRDDESLDEGGIESLARFYVERGVDGVVALGIMGEAHKLSDAERAAVVERYVSAVGGEVPVVVGCSAAATRVAIQRARDAEEAGAAAVMVAPPNGLRNLDLVYEYFARVAGAVSVPVVVQDEPVNTGVVMPAAFIARVVNELENCRYVKLEEAPTTVKISSLLQGIRNDEKRSGIFGGLGGTHFFEELGRGAAGTMTGFAYPEILVRIYNHFAAGREDEARAEFYRYLPLIRFEAQLGVGGVGIRKAIFRRRGTIESSRVRHPAPALDEGTLGELDALILHLGLDDSPAPI